MVVAVRHDLLGQQNLTSRGRLRPVLLQRRHLVSCEVKDDQERASYTEGSVVEDTHQHSDHRGIDHAENDGDLRHLRVRQGFKILPRNGSGKISGDTLQSAFPREGIAECFAKHEVDAVATMLKHNFGSIVNEDCHAKEWQLESAR